MNILYVSSEVSPYSKSGGLADVAGYLPIEIKKLGQNISVIMPKYKCVQEKMEFITSFYINHKYCGLLKFTKNGLDYFAIDNEEYFLRDNLYGYDDDFARFEFFSKAVIKSIEFMESMPDILHLNDWHSGICSHLSKEKYPNIKTMFTIHNLKYQGKYKDFNPMRDGILNSDLVSTVSESYKNEIKTKFYGEGLEDEINSRGENVIGILNGIDKNNFDINDKEKYKKELLLNCGFEYCDDKPLFAMISRFSSQKGLDLVDRIMSDMPDAHFLFLGTGEEKYENIIRKYAQQYPHKIKAFINFDINFAQKVYKGADFFLMPSLFEPCGLAQMMAMQNGTIPIARETGGLCDTIQAYNKYTGEGTGLSFANYNAHEFLEQIENAMELYKNKTMFNKIRNNAMQKDFSITKSAQKYIKAYKKITFCDVYHTISSTKFRKPIGAVLQSSYVRISLRGYNNAKIKIITQDSQEVFAMQNSKDDETISFIDVLMPAKAGIVYYHFIVGEKFYGRDDETLSGKIVDENPNSFQITVYKQNDTAKWFKEGVVYQIFPDSFCKFGETAPKANCLIQSQWQNLPTYQKDENGKIINWVFYGGNLQGIISKLDYLQTMGISIIYLNPIFKAKSSHRYDTADYMQIDEMLGTEKDFENLILQAKKRGINIILDGVFSHTGADSIYFNKENTFFGIGAYQGKESKYYDWYNFRKDGSYDCWWGDTALPNVDEMNDSYRNYIYKSSTSVIKKWLDLGVMGLRLDVADELPDEFIEELRAYMKKINPQSILIGEVWEDASNKISYGKKRRYFYGDNLDGVMNYPFRDTLIDFAIEKISPKLALNKLMDIIYNYPKQNLENCMNLLGSHDTTRIFSIVNKRDKIKMLYAILFSLIGAPCIYYGDEKEMTGGVDPYNRGSYPWENDDNEIYEYIKRLSYIRKKYILNFIDEDIEAIENENLLCFKFQKNTEQLLIISNPTESTQSIEIEKSTEIITDKNCEKGSIEILPNSTNIFILK